MSMMRGHLKLMILNTMDNNSLSGTEIMSQLEKNIGWKPSCGSIYPILKSLEEEKLAVRKHDKSSTKKTYTLTKKGIDELKKHNSNKEELLNEIIKVHKMIESTYGVNLNLDDKNFSREIKDNIRTGGIVLKYFKNESDEMRKEFMLLIKEGLAEKKSKQIKEIMHNATKDFRILREQAGVNKSSAKIKV